MMTGLFRLTHLSLPHSFRRNRKGDPVLIRIETKAGHGAGTPVSKPIEQYADIFRFTLWNMGIKKLEQ